MAFWTVKSRSDYNVIFLFREVGLNQCDEIKVVVTKKNELAPSHFLKAEEIKHIKEEYLTIEKQD